jgi:hypothetical protein
MRPRTITSDHPARAATTRSYSEQKNGRNRPDPAQCSICFEEYVGWGHNAWPFRAPRRSGGKRT